MPIERLRASGQIRNGEIERNRQLGLERIADLENFLATIVATMRANAVGPLRLAAMGAVSCCGSAQSIVCSALVAASLGVSSFGMGHGI